MTRYYNTYRHLRRLVSVSLQSNRLFLITLFALAFILVSSCEKGILKTGSDILPDGDFVSVKSIDTLSVFSYTVSDDSIRSDNPTYGYVGHVFDPYFGTTTAGFVTQLRLASRWGGGQFTIDSVRLYLNLLSASGGTDVVHTLKLSEISDIIFPDSTYYSKRNVNVTSFVSNIQLPVLRSDTINNVVLNVPIEFGSYLLRDTSQLFYYPNAIHFSYAHPDFRSYFRGLYFEMDPGTDPLLVSLYLEPPVVNTTHATPENALAIYFHDENATAHVFDFILDASSKNAAFNVFKFDYSTAEPGKRINHINDGFRDSLSYQQSLNGVYTKIVLPGLEKIKKEVLTEKFAVNKARLVVPAKFDKTATNQFISKTLPSVLALRYKTKTGEKALVADYTMSGGSDSYIFFDGRLDTVKQVYNFNIPAFTQAYLEDATDELKPEVEVYQGAGLDNVILRGNKNSPTIKFEFTYTKF
jgi:hypothetical protein